MLVTDHVPIEPAGTSSVPRSLVSSACSVITKRPLGFHFRSGDARIGVGIHCRALAGGPTFKEREVHFKVGIAGSDRKADLALDIGGKQVVRRCRLLQTDGHACEQQPSWPRDDSLAARCLEDSAHAGFSMRDIVVVLSRQSNAQHAICQPATNTVTRL